MTTYTTTAKKLLEVMSIRFTMQQQGIVNPPENIKFLTKKLVNDLSLLPEEENISFVIDKDHGKYIQESTGKVLVKISLKCHQRKLK